MARKRCTNKSPEARRTLVMQVGGTSNHTRGLHASNFFSSLPGQGSTTPVCFIQYLYPSPKMIFCRSVAKFSA